MEFAECAARRNKQTIHKNTLKNNKMSLRYRDIVNITTELYVHNIQYP